MSRRQAVPSNWFLREADPLPPLYPQPVDGDHYFNPATGKLRVFLDGLWGDAVEDIPEIDYVTLDARYVNSNQLIVSDDPASGTPAGGIDTVWIEY